MQELIGLRKGGLTLFVPTMVGRLNEPESYAVLVITGLFNVGVAAAVLVSAAAERRRCRYRPELDSSPGAEE